MSNGAAVEQVYVTLLSPCEVVAENVAELLAQMKGETDGKCND